MQFSQILGYIATFLFSIMYIPQIVKTLRLRQVDNVSVGMWVLGLIANVVALWYAVLINQAPLVVKYVISLVVIVIYLTLYFKIRGKK